MITRYDQKHKSAIIGLMCYRHTTHGVSPASVNTFLLGDPRDVFVGGFITSSQPFPCLSWTHAMYFFTLSSR